MINILDPRPASLESQLDLIRAAREEGKVRIGLEVTVPLLAQEMHFNIDPQHEGGDSTMSCIKACAEGALSFPLSRGNNYAFFTVRPDLDSFGSYVVAQWLMQCQESELDNCRDRIHPSAFDRIELVHKADCFLNDGKWTLRDSPGGYDQPELAAIARCVSDFKTPVEDRVSAMKKWLEYGTEPEEYRKAYEKEKLQIEIAIAMGETQVAAYGCDFETGTSWYPVDHVYVGGLERTGYCYVKSTLRAATSIGYSKAPVVVAYNPEFPDRNLGEVKKFTICQYAPGYVDLKEVFRRLNELEPGWGGSPTIGGSPQGVSSTISPLLVCDIVQDCMIL